MKKNVGFDIDILINFSHISILRIVVSGLFVSLNIVLKNQVKLPHGL